MKNWVLGLCAALFLIAPAYANEDTAIETYEFDRAHTQILFFVDHLGFSKSQGEFLDYDGSFTINRGNPAESGVNVAIKTASIDMDDEKWDEHLKGADFFNVEKFPTMTFKSTSIVTTGDNTADVIGDLTLLGVTKPVTLNMTHNKSDVHPFSGKFVAGFSGEAVIKRSDFNMNYGLPGVADDVHIRIEVEGLRQELGAEGTQNP